jgi:hypothetical protein
MQAATNEQTSDPLGHTISTTSKSESSDTIEVLEELLAHSIHLRDMLSGKPPTFSFACCANCSTVTTRNRSSS